MKIPYKQLRAGKTYAYQHGNEQGQGRLFAKGRTCQGILLSFDVRKKWTAGTADFDHVLYHDLKTIEEVNSNFMARELAENAGLLS